MKINFSAELKTLDGQTIKETTADDSKPATLAVFAVNALNAQLEEEKNLDGAEKFKRYQLAAKVYNGGEVELTSDEAAKIKGLIGKIYPPLIVGQCWPLLDG